MVLLSYFTKVLDNANIFRILLIAFGELLLEVLIHLYFYIHEEDIVKHDVVGIDYGYFPRVLGLIL